jgi:4-hydroxybenzoate polyprenyltransferase
MFSASTAVKETYLSLFAAFCLSSSFVYIINDIKDVENDRNHPIKKQRPIANGEISLRTAIIIAIICLLTTFYIVYEINLYSIGICISLYIVLNIIYTFYAKNIGIIDVICLAFGFVLRVIAGSFPMSQKISQWLIIMVFLLCIFLALGKRWNDVSIMEENKTKNEIGGKIRGEIGREIRGKMGEKLERKVEEKMGEKLGNQSMIIQKSSCSHF